MYGARVMSLMEATLAHRALKIKKKKDLATATRTAAGEVDVDMAVPSTSAALIKQLVDKAVASALKSQPPSSNKRKREQPTGNASGSGGGDAQRQKKMKELKVGPSRIADRLSDASFLGAVRSGNSQAVGGEAHVCPPSLWSTKVSELDTKGDKKASASARRQQAAGFRRRGNKGKWPPWQKEEGQLSMSWPASTYSNVVMGPIVSTCPSIRGASSPIVAVDNRVHGGDNCTGRGLFICEGDLWIANPT